MSASGPDRPITPLDFARWKSQGRKAVIVTAYDHPTARRLDAAGIDSLLVGDSLGMVVQGWDSTLRVTLDQMIYHAEMVARGASRALVVVDLPFMSYQVSVEQALTSAGRVFKETQARAVKVEGGRRASATIKALVEAGMPVMGHVGLTPQSVRALGGFRVQRDEERLLDDARAVAEAGAFALVVECVPAALAERITRTVPIATIGIGAGIHCDGQVLVYHDLVGLSDDVRPRFARRYIESGASIDQAAAAFAEDVRAGRFPGPDESFS